MADIFAGIVEMLNPPAHIRVRVEGELPVIVTAGAQLEQVLRNLINNAIKHHDKPSREVVLCAKRALREARRREAAALLDTYWRVVELPAG